MMKSCPSCVKSSRLEAGSADVGRAIGMVVWYYVAEKSKVGNVSQSEKKRIEGSFVHVNSDVEWSHSR